MMNDQENTLVRQSKWSGRRIVLFYWFAIVFLGTSAAAGLGTSVFKPVYKIEADPHDGITDPWGPEDCNTCHADEVAGWQTTWHSQMLGEYADGTDDPQNGTRLNWNSTHFWRIPKTVTNVSEPTDYSNIRYWTYNQIFNASGQQCCMTTRWSNVTLINATTGEELAFNATLSAELYPVELYASNIWDIGVSCAACHKSPGEITLSYTACSGCHTPGGRQWMGYRQSGHYGSLADLLASSDITTQTLLHYTGYWSYVGQSTYMVMGSLDSSDYYQISCATCHDPHNATINTDDESTSFSPWTNPYTGELFGPGGRQLRAATINDLCGICHDVSLNTSAAGYLDPSDHGTLDCTDCHGYSYTPAKYFENGTLEAASKVSSLSHNWIFGGTSDACGVCHDENASTVYATMLEYQAEYSDLSGMKSSYDTKLAAAQTAFDTANATDGADAAKLANALALIGEAKELATGTSLTFHNPELGLAVEEEQLSLALTKLDAALVDATDALPEVVVPPTTTTEPVTEEPTTTTASAIGLLAVMSILGVVALFSKKRR